MPVQQSAHLLPLTIPFTTALVVLPWLSLLSAEVFVDGSMRPFRTLV